MWDGFRVYRVYTDHNGELYAGGAKFVVFDEGLLVGAYSDEGEAKKGFMRGDRVAGVRLSEFKGIQEGLR